MNRRAAVTPVRRRSASGVEGDHDLVAVEAGLMLSVRRTADEEARRLGLLMRTPGDDEELVLGFLYTESVIAGAGDVDRVDVTAGGSRDTDSAVVTLADHVRWPPDALERNLAMTSACGLCGRLEVIALDQGRGCPAGQPRLDAAFVQTLPGRLRDGQSVFSETGGLHAAALIGTDGARELIREDVGRHNAVDKVIGAALRRGWLPGHSLMLAVSGRVAYEIVQKAVTAGLPAVVALGAPSSLAVEAARATSLTLVGFVRGDRYNVYAGWDRLSGGDWGIPRGLRAK